MSEVRQAWRLRSRPKGEIGPGDLELVTEPRALLRDGEVEVRVDLISLDPTNRIWMSETDQYMAPVEVGDIMRAGIAGRVIASRSPYFDEGTMVAGLGGWTTHLVADPAHLQPMDENDELPLVKRFGSLGGTGLTAYFGLLEICKPRPGETLVVSAASGAVGSIVGQLGKMHGCRVIGIAGGSEKCRYVTEQLGFDACIDYKNENVADGLDVLCPNGIDMNFENVGGAIMEDVMQRMNNYSRMALCGMISTYNAEGDVPGPSTWPLILMRRITVQGFIVSDFADRFEEAGQQLAQWSIEGKIKTREDVRTGIENAVDVLKDLYSGKNFGKLLLQV